MNNAGSSNSGRSVANALNYGNDTNNNHVREDDEIQNLIREAQNLNLTRVHKNVLIRHRDFNEILYEDPEFPRNIDAINGQEILLLPFPELLDLNDDARRNCSAYRRFRPRRPGQNNIN